MYTYLLMALAAAATNQGNYEESENILKNVKPEYAERQTYHYCRLVNNFAANNKAEAYKHGKILEDDFDFKNMPRRQYVLTLMFLDDLEKWKTDDLADIARDMKHVGGRLEVAKGGPGTQKIQKEIVAKLDKQIKDLEDKAKGKGQGQGESDKGLPGQGQSGNSNPAEDSKIMGGAGKGVVDDKKLRQYAQSWGTLPPAERQAVVKEITRDLPEKYKPMIEEYFKSLNRTTNSNGRQ